MERFTDPVLLVRATVAFLGVLTLVWVSGTDTLVGSILLIVFLGWGLLGAYGILSFIRAARWRGDHWLEHQAIGWAGCLLVLTVTLQLGVLGVPGHVRFRISANALTDTGERVLAGEHPTRAALYGFGETRVVDGCALMMTARFVFDESGWAYCPDSRPTSPPYDHVEGALYTYFID